MGFQLCAHKHEPGWYLKSGDHLFGWLMQNKPPKLSDKSVRRVTKYQHCLLPPWYSWGHCLGTAGDREGQLRQGQGTGLSWDLHFQGGIEQ